MMTGGLLSPAPSLALTKPTDTLFDLDEDVPKKSAGGGAVKRPSSMLNEGGHVVVCHGVASFTLEGSAGATSPGATSPGVA